MAFGSISPLQKTQFVVAAKVNSMNYTSRDAESLKSTANGNRLLVKLIQIRKL